MLDTSYAQNDRFVLYNGDCREILRELPENSIDACVCDPPYGLEFMGKEWDKLWDSRGGQESFKHGDIGTVRNKPTYTAGIGAQEFHESWAREVFRVLKPGGYLLAFGGARTYHRLACAVEDAGFEIRDQIMWIYGSGFPKSMNVAIAFDKHSGVMTDRGAAFRTAGAGDHEDIQDKNGVAGIEYHRGISDLAKQWSGWGTALKPAHEPIVVARKPLIGTVIRNVEKYGTGGLNIDDCRIDLDGDYKSKPNGRPSQTGLCDNYDPVKANQPDTVGRWPANVIHDGSEEVTELFPHTKSGALLKHHKRTGGTPPIGTFTIRDRTGEGEFLGSEGSAARFFYCAKTSKSERGDGNTHPTVKPLALMKYLIKLVTQPGGTVLDPFAGSGSTLIAALEQDFNAIGIEQSEEYCEIVFNRLLERNLV